MTSSQRTSLGRGHGAVPDGLPVFDDESPAVANLDPDLLDALRRAAADAAADGVAFVVNGGWRSWAYQEQLRRQGIAKHGSEAAAARWVTTADKSAHGRGQGGDIGPPPAPEGVGRHRAPGRAGPDYPQQ